MLFGRYPRLDMDRERAPRKITGPRGHEFEDLGPAAPVQLKPASRASAEAGQDLLVVKEGALFVCSRRDGDIWPGFPTGQGLYSGDTRYLSEMRLTVGGKAPVLLSSTADLGYEAFVDMSNPALDSCDGTPIPQMSLQVRRVRLVSDRLYERVEIKNHGRAAVQTTVGISLGADFADMFEIRGVGERARRGHALGPKSTEIEIRFAYVGEDDLFRETVISFDPKPESMEVSQARAEARWSLDLAPRETMEIELSVEASLQGKRARRRSFRTAEARTASLTQEWLDSSARIHFPHHVLAGVFDAAMRDLRALVTPVEGGEVMAAGIPWYVAPFGRDSLLTCYEMLLVKPEPARQTLLYLAQHQAKMDDEFRDAEPGKILHELRSGELARAGFVPHRPYYGAVDSTPLFLMLAAAYWRWTADLDTMHKLMPSCNAALRWIDESGDLDGDGFVEYLKRSPAGLDNQGWKDSKDSIVHADGSTAAGPIALVEVQGYVYMAKERIAEVYEVLGDRERAGRLRHEAEELKERFNRAFWMPNEGTFAVALDGGKRQVRSVTSNPGHCLYCGIVDEEKAGAVASRLMSPDMFSGWGVRTLSSKSPAFNPMSYHNGSIWPHDNAIIAAGLKRYGFSDGAERIATGLFSAALQSPVARLPELYCGFSREHDASFVPYPVACSPQAWAAAVPFMVLQSLLGISARAPEGLLTIKQPQLPEWMGSVRLEGIRVGDSRVDLAFSSTGRTTPFVMVERSGNIRVAMHE
jgi:glycogen debranching enzyme